MYSIYRLKDPITNEVKYIGKTKLSLESRLYLHFRDREQKKEANGLKANWLINLHEVYNTKPIIELIELIEDKVESSEREVYWIEHYFRNGCNLVNTQGNYYDIFTKKKRKRYKKTIYCYTKEYSELVFDSARHAERVLGVSYKTISTIATNNPKHKAYDCIYMFSFIQIEDNKIIDAYFKRKEYLDSNIIATNLTTGEELTFKTQTEAGAYINRNFKNISQVLKGFRKSCGGYKFEYEIDKNK